MKIVAVLPPSEQVQAQVAMLGALFAGHTLSLATTEEEMNAHLEDMDVLISTAFTPIKRAHLEQAKRLRFIQVAGVGVDHVDVQAAQDLGIAVACVTGANTVSVAEHVVMVALSLLRGLIPAHNLLAKGEWSLPLWISKAKDMQSKTFGIVGMGRIGREVASRLLPFQVTMFYYDEHPLPAADEDALGVTLVDWETLIAESDIVTLHIPLTDATRGVLNKEAFQRMKPGAFLINTARSELVDEAALVDALKSGHLGGAAIDVFSPEPPDPQNPLLTAPNVILSPHGAGVTLEAQQRIAQGVVQNLLRYVEGKPVADVVIPGSR